MSINHTAIISINYTTPPFMQNTILIWHDHWPVWCDFDRASSLICGNEMPTRCNRGFYCTSYCLLNMFRGTTIPIMRSSRVSYSGCCLWYFLLWFSSCCSGVELGVMCPVCRMLQHPANRTHNPQLHTRPATWKPQHEILQAATTVWYYWAPDGGNSAAPKHVEQAIRSAIKTSVASSWHFISTLASCYENGSTPRQLELWGYKWMSCDAMYTRLCKVPKTHIKNETV